MTNYIRAMHSFIWTAHMSFSGLIKVTLVVIALILPFYSWSQGGLSPRQIKKLTVEELLNIEVTLVSRTPEKLTQVPSAIQVITGEDIRRSGATNVPEALRLAPNLQVMQLSSHAWIISARGFNSVFSNKLLVMIDGRTVYTPLYGGVLWDQQNVLLEDVERIEVISGPGGTLWGANAVNGVINIVTRNSNQTQGLYALVVAGTFIQDIIGLRYGGDINDKINYRVYTQHYDRKSTKLPDGTTNADAWGLTQAGFRMDWEAGKKNAFTVQGDHYWGKRKTVPAKADLNGQHIIGRWTRTISDRSDLMVQLYFDRYYIEDGASGASDEMNTVDLDFQHRFPIGSKHTIVWGAGYRYVKDDAFFPPASAAAILPRFKRLDLFNGFIHDEIHLTKNLRFSVGTKLLHNVYTGLEWQPNARLAWINKGNTLWAAVSRAVRTPSRFDVDYYLPPTPQPPTTPSVAGGPNFVSEKLIAYEAGYRLQPNAVSSFSLSVFYNVYRDVYSVEPLPGTVTYQIQNGSEAETWGAEFAGNYHVSKKWRLRGGYTFFKKDIRPKAGHNFNPSYLGNDVRNQVMLQSMLDLPFNLELDFIGRYLDPLSQTFATADVPAYLTFDARLAYTYKNFEFSVVGQNLAEKNHVEFGTFNMPRHVYAKISARL